MLVIGIIILTLEHMHSAEKRRTLCYGISVILSHAIIRLEIPLHDFSLSPKGFCAVFKVREEPSRVSNRDARVET
jgi:hypothetical protein